ncbi:MAG: EthD family reductase [Gammaproteobacteria bacterium]
MLHVFYFITRKKSLDDAAFHRYWKEVHGPIVKKIGALKRYVQLHRVPFPNQNSPYDGAAEVWVENEAALDAIMRDPAYLDGALADEPNFIDMSCTEWLTAEDHVFIDGAPPPTAVKMVFPLKRQRHFSHAEGKRYWLDVHGPIVAAVPGLCRYVQSHTIDAAYRYAEPRWDGVAQLWLDGVAAVEKMLVDPAFKEVAWADTVKFVDMKTIESFVGEEHVVIP